MKRLYTMILAVAAMVAATPVSAYDIEYYLPAKNVNFNSSVPTPAQYLGYEIGEQFVDWGQITGYMQALEKASDRVSIKTFGQTYEKRRYIQVAITSPENQKNLEKIRQEHLSLTDAAVCAGLDIKEMPIVVDIMGSIHGNEASGVNAMLPIAYYFVAAEDQNVKDFLQKTVLILTPGLNPDGINRFASWVNTNSSINQINDQNARVRSEMSPSSRANHYWNDCNRDWLNVQHKEGQNGVEMYLYWMPNVVLDLHEQGSYKRGWYYFSPGDPDRTHEYIPQENQDLTKAISKATKAAFDSMQVKCFTERGYDDFYIGKGAAYGDVQGSVCFLHEQTGTYGHYRDFGEAGFKDFEFTVRNQSVASVTLAFRSLQLKDTLMSYMRNFYLKSAVMAAADKYAGYVFDARGDRGTAYNFIKMLERHQIEVYPVAGKEGTYAVPFNQKYYWKIKTIFEDITSYKDNIFYDISTWTLPRAFNLNYSLVANMPKLGEKIADPVLPQGTVAKNDIGYAFDMKEYYTPKFVAALQRKGVNVYSDDKGNLYIPAKGQKLSSDELYETLSKFASENSVNLSEVKKEKTLAETAIVRQPHVAIIVDAGGSYQKAGQIWKLLDDTYNINHSIVNFGRLDSDKCLLSTYNAIICYGRMPKNKKKEYAKLKKWLEDGGTLVLYNSAANLSSILGYPAIKREEGKNKEYAGAIFKADFKNAKSPLLWGYDQKSIDVFKYNDDVYKLPQEASLVMQFADKPYLSGCVTPAEIEAFTGAPVVATIPAGKGNIVFIAEDFHFRAVWQGTSHILTNALYFGDRL